MATIPNYIGFGYNKQQTNNARDAPRVTDKAPGSGQNASPYFHEPRLPYKMGSPETDQKVSTSFYEPSYSQTLNQHKILQQVESHCSKFSSDGDNSKTDSYDDIPLDI